MQACRTANADGCAGHQELRTRTDLAACTRYGVPYSCNAPKPTPTIFSARLPHLMCHVHAVLFVRTIASRTFPNQDAVFAPTAPVMHELSYGRTTAAPRFPHLPRRDAPGPTAAAMLHAVPFGRHVLCHVLRDTCMPPGPPV